MNEMIAYCGIACQKRCPIYLATREKNKEKRKKMRMEVVRLCKEQYGLEYKLEDITDCDGCLTEKGRLFPTCKNCPIKKCARQKRLENCAYCSEYACEKLEKFFVTDPSAKRQLEKIRSRL